MGVRNNDRITTDSANDFRSRQGNTLPSAYSSEGDYDGLAQLKDMRDSLEEDDGYSIANTMSTPMLVNDWKYHTQNDAIGDSS